MHGSFGSKEYRKVARYIDIVKDEIWHTIEKNPKLTFCPCGYKTGVEFPDSASFLPFENGDRFGSGCDSHAWFHLTHEPVGEDVWLRAHSDKDGWDASNPQFLLYINGKAVQGFDTNHREARLPVGVPLDVFIYAYTGAAIAESQFFCTFVKLDKEAERLYYDLLFLFQTLSFLDGESDAYQQNLEYLYNAVSMLDLFEVGSKDFRESVVKAYTYLENEYYGKECGVSLPSVTCIGHTHIDCAWLWTLNQTKEKVQRSFSTVLSLMEMYPDYKFMSSQPLLYKYLKEEDPETFERVKKRVEEGRWECEGAMWVEADCNLSSGESLVRQVMYGKEFFKKEFNKDSRVLWLPDVFGYSAALPQILKKCGVDWFVTSKISWNDKNRMPYDTFSWKGIDGTEINSFFLTAQQDDGNESRNGTSYVANTNAEMISGAYKRYQQKNISREAMVTYGFGDGGGGPTKQHIELLMRAEKGVLGVPTAKSEFAGDFLKRLENRIENNPQLPKWNGELYLEFHRGTYTSQARNKKNNRKSEILFQMAELESLTAKKLAGVKYPVSELHEGWETILTNQFHDIIPGSSIREVYEYCEKDYAKIKNIGENAINTAREALCSSISSKHGTIVINDSSFGGTVPVKIDGKTIFAEDIPQNGYSVLHNVISDNHISINNNVVNTDIYTVAFDDNMNINSIIDKRENREVISKGNKANILEVYVDLPDQYDNWEWQEYSRESLPKIICDVSDKYIVDDGVRKGIHFVRRHMSSTIEQTIWFYDNLERIDFETELDWHEHHQMLKTAFPVDINSAYATYEIQYGSTQRPTHFNTSWDRARFEVCAHKYADLSDGGYGVGIINDCKYGHDIHDGVIRLSLLKCGTYPDEEADQGKMSFTYALCPHKGSFTQSNTIREAYLLNYPPVAVKASGNSDIIPLSYSVVTANKDNIICGAAKQAENGDGSAIRLFETMNMRSDVEISTDIGISKVYLCDMLENPIREIPTDGKTFNYVFGGFEIATFKLI